MSENKKYYWLKLKKDFFNQKMIKILNTFPQGDKMILTFLKLELHALENDGYIYYENMLPTFEQELSIAIDEETSLVKMTLEMLIKFGAIEKKDENKYYITALEDCIGSETKDAARMRRKRSEQCSSESEHCPPEIEIEKEKEKESDIDKKRTPSSFSDEKKGGRYGQKNNFFNNSYYGKNKPAKKTASYDIDEVMRENEERELVYVPRDKEEKPDLSQGFIYCMSATKQLKDDYDS
ncbi:MAG: phage replisome organizer N-terminal domain-containing protein [Clostridia bacterium]|nr:phage replisome organizer N-terminal domain-containing protein [Clostridia bacterium]